MKTDHRRILNKSAEDYLEKYDEYWIEILIDDLQDLQVEDVPLAVEEWHSRLPDPNEWAGSMAVDEYEHYQEDKADYERERIKEDV